jgi:hypothetical protein
VPTEEILGRVCKKCNAIRELAEFTGKEWDRKKKASCRKCKPEHDRAGRRSGSKKMKISEGEGKMIARELDGSAHQRPVRRTARWQPAVKYDIDMESDGSSDSEESSDDARPSLWVRMRTANPRYNTHEDDDNRGYVIIPMSNVKELIRLKEKLDEAAAIVWLTTAEMGFSLTDEQHMLLCPKDVREGKVIHRYLAPAISRFAIDIQAEKKGQPTLDRAEEELRREIVNLHQRWGKVREESQDDDIRERARGSATETQGFTRIIRRKNLTWERDSIARVTYDPAHISDCNVHATVGKQFLFHEPIPYAKIGHGYLRVTKSSLQWQQREFPGASTSEGLTTCVEK